MHLHDNLNATIFDPLIIRECIILILMITLINEVKTIILKEKHYKSTYETILPSLYGILILNSFR